MEADDEEEVADEVLPCPRAVARENGRPTPSLLDSGRGLAIVDRRPVKALALVGGERPAGFRMGADLGVAGVIFRGVEGPVTFRAIREVLKGLTVVLRLSSSSSKVRLRLLERDWVAGSTFSESSSMKVGVFAETAMPVVMMSVGIQNRPTGNQ